MFVEAIWKLFRKEMAVRLVLAIWCTLGVAVDVCGAAPTTISSRGSVGHVDRAVFCRSWSVLSQRRIAMVQRGLVVAAPRDVERMNATAPLAMKRSRPIPWAPTMLRWTPSKDIPTSSTSETILTRKKGKEAWGACGKEHRRTYKQSLSVWTMRLVQSRVSAEEVADYA